MWGLSAQPPFLLLTRPPGSAPWQPRAGNRAHFPRANAAGGRILAHTSLPAAPPADKAQPHKGTSTSPAGPACGKASLQPQGKPGQHLEPVTARARQAGKDCGTGQAGDGRTGQAGDGGTGREAAGSLQGWDAEPGTDTCTHTHPLHNEGKYLSPLRLLWLLLILPRPRHASSTLPVLHVPTPGRAARPSSPPPVGFGPRCLLAFWQPRRSSDGMCPFFFFFFFFPLSPFHNPSSPAFSAGVSGAACGASSQGNWQRARHRDPPAADGALPGAGSPSASH